MVVTAKFTKDKARVDAGISAAISIKYRRQSPGLKLNNPSGNRANKRVKKNNHMDTLAVDADILAAIRQIYDPEIPVNIYDLGLIYEIRVEDDGQAFVTMTLTSPNCPVAESLPEEVQQTVQDIKGVTKANIQLTFNPTWNKEMMTDEAKLDLGLL